MRYDCAILGRALSPETKVIKGLLREAEIPVVKIPTGNVLAIEKIVASDTPGVNAVTHIRHWWKSDEGRKNYPHSQFFQASSLGQTLIVLARSGQLRYENWGFYPAHHSVHIGECEPFCIPYKYGGVRICVAKALWAKVPLELVLIAATSSPMGLEDSLSGNLPISPDNIIERR